MRSRSVRNAETSTPGAIWKKYAVYRSSAGKTPRTTLWSTKTPEVNWSACSRTPTIVRFTVRPAASNARIRSPGTTRRRLSSGTNWFGPVAVRSTIASV